MINDAINMWLIFMVAIKANLRGQVFIQVKLQNNNAIHISYISQYSNESEFRKICSWITAHNRRHYRKIFGAKITAP